eukprot:GHVU01190932.1.p2 GENE.GHVU01190932.1~~GHVU01190932.1.p2  ORF type:complete len:126 (+),score=1.73 GHVU01190932.1:237-614(+)
MSEFGRPSRTRRPAPQYHEEAEQPTHGEGERKLRVVTAGSCQGNGTSRARMGVAYLIPDGTGRWVGIWVCTGASFRRCPSPRLLSPRPCSIRVIVRGRMDVDLWLPVDCPHVCAGIHWTKVFVSR